LGAPACGAATVDVVLSAMGGGDHYVEFGSSRRNKRGGTRRAVQ
jgi:hypothetical protein